jgi:gas vesicle protein
MSDEENVVYVEDEGGHVWGSILAGVVIGALVGGALALLFAPKPGTQVRADLEGAVDDLRDRAEQAIDELQSSATDLVTRSRSLLDQTREHIARSVEAGKEAYVQKKEELTSQLETE